MYAYKTDFPIAQTTPQPSSYIFLHCNRKEGNVTKSNTHAIILDSNHRHPGQKDSNPPVHLLKFLHDHLSEWHDVYVRIDVLRKNDKKTKTVPAAGRRREQGEARPAIRAPRGRPHLDLGRLRLKLALNRTSRLLGRNGKQHYPHCIYI